MGIVSTVDPKQRRGEYVVQVALRKIPFAPVDITTDIKRNVRCLIKQDNGTGKKWGFVFVADFLWMKMLMKVSNPVLTVGYYNEDN